MQLGEMVCNICHMYILGVYNRCTNTHGSV